MGRVVWHSYRDKYSDMIDIVKVSETMKVGETDLVRVKDNHRDSQEVTVPLTLQWHWKWQILEVIQTMAVNMTERDSGIDKS